jgi:hypothetical protein
LLDELRRIDSDAEAFLYIDSAEGIKDFADETGVKADKLPDPKDLERIKKEERLLPPINPINTSITLMPEPDATNMSALLKLLRMASSGRGRTVAGFPPPFSLPDLTGPLQDIAAVEHDATKPEEAKPPEAKDKKEGGRP